MMTKRQNNGEDLVVNPAKVSPAIAARCAHHAQHLHHHHHHHHYHHHHYHHRHNRHHHHNRHRNHNHHNLHNRKHHHDNHRMPRKEGGGSAQFFLCSGHWVHFVPGVRGQWEAPVIIFQSQSS